MHINNKGVLILAYKFYSINLQDLNLHFLIKFYWTILILFACVGLLSAQDIPLNIRNQIESFVENNELDDVDLDQIYDRLSTYLQKPVDLNKVDSEDLAELLLFTPIQLAAFDSYRSEYGPIIAIEEIQSIQGFDLESAKILSQIAAVKMESNFHVPIHQMLYKGKNEIYTKWIRTIEKQRGFNDSLPTHYLGDPNKYAIRYKYNYENRLRYGFILEKDAGEQFFRGSNPLGFDYMSFHLYLKDYSYFLKDVAIGDFTISMGQGLISHNDFGAGKSAWVTNVRKGGRSIRPYSSVNENAFNRGVGVTIRPIKNVELTAFGSYVKRDGNISEVVDDDGFVDIRFSSFTQSGYHRTALEILKENEIEEQKIGGILKYKTKDFHVGFNGMFQKFDTPLQRANSLANKFLFNGDQLTNLSFDYSFKIKNFFFFGETAHSLNSGFGNIHGILAGLDRKTSLVLLYRDFDPDYHALLPNAFGERASNNNERGIYLGLDVKINYQWRFRTYADLWRHDWLKFQTDSPTNGKEYIARLDFTIKRKLNIYSQYFHERKFDNSSTGERIDPVLAQIKQRLRFNLNYNVNKSITLRSRAEFSWFKQNSKVSRGYLGYQDILFKSIDFPLQFTMRYAIFNTDDYDSRIYAYENDLIYEFYIPPFFYRGSRYYLNLRYRGIRNLMIEARYSRTYYDNQETVGSALNEIDGNTQTVVKAQIKYSF